MIQYVLFYLQSHASTSDASSVLEDGIPVVDKVMDGRVDPRASSTLSTSGLYIVLSVLCLLLRSYYDFLSCDH
jgi:hypothetical protein